jgi:hypothetical protein
VTGGWGAVLESPFSVMFNTSPLVPYQVLFLPAVAGTVVAARGFLRRERDVAGLMVVVLLTTFACFPILRDAWPRALAASIAFHAGLAAVGAAALVGVPLRLRPTSARRSDPLTVLGSTVAALLLLAPVAVKLARPRDLAALTAPSCEAGEVPMAYRASRGSSLTIDGPTRTALYTSGSLQSFRNTAAVPDGASFRDVANLLTPDDVAFNFVVIENPGDEPPPGAIVRTCAQLRTEGRWWQRVYTARVVP